MSRVSRAVGTHAAVWFHWSCCTRAFISRVSTLTACRLASVPLMRASRCRFCWNQMLCTLFSQITVTLLFWSYLKKLCALTQYVHKGSSWKGRKWCIVAHVNAAVKDQLKIYTSSWIWRICGYDIVRWDLSNRHWLALISNGYSHSSQLLKTNTVNIYNKH